MIFNENVMNFYQNVMNFEKNTIFNSFNTYFNIFLIIIIKYIVSKTFLYPSFLKNFLAPPVAIFFSSPVFDFLSALRWRAGRACKGGCR